MNYLPSVMLTLIFAVLAPNLAKAGPVSEIKTDETLIFFNTSAWLDEQSQQWHIPIHGWIYEEEDSVVRKNLIAKALSASYDLVSNEQSQPLFDQRINLLLADNERGKSIVIRFANRTYTLPESSANGHFKVVLQVDANILAEADIEDLLTFQAVLTEKDQRLFSGHVNLVNPQGISVISDIDDTIKISAVTDRKQLLKHTFLLEFKAFPGMAELYTTWLKQDGALHFVSSSPWQLYTPLVEFIAQSGFPVADYRLKSFRFRDSSLLNLFASSL